MNKMALLKQNEDSSINARKIESIHFSKATIVLVEKTFYFHVI